MSEGLEYNGATIVGGTISGLDLVSGIRATTPQEREIMIVHHDKWNECMGDGSILPESKKANYIVESNRGVSVAAYHQRLDGAWVFQDIQSGDDEGMIGWGDAPYEVYRWMPLPKGKNAV